MNAIEQLKSVLCDLEGKCRIHGTDADREVVDSALALLSEQVANNAKVLDGVEPVFADIAVGKTELVYSADTVSALIQRNEALEARVKEILAAEAAAPMQKTVRFHRALSDARKLLEQVK